MPYSDPLQHVRRFLNVPSAFLFVSSFCFLFFRPALNPTYLTYVTSTSPPSHGIMCFFFSVARSFSKRIKGKKTKFASRRAAGRVSAAAAGGHLSKYITVIWIKTTDVWIKMSYDKLESRVCVSSSTHWKYEEASAGSSPWQQHVLYKYTQGHFIICLHMNT